MARDSKPVRHGVSTRCLAWSALAGILLMTVTAVWANEGHQHVEEPREPPGIIDPTLLGFSGLKEVFNVHPAFVHFPLALFPSALLLYGLGIVLKRPSWTMAGRACLYLGAAGTVITIWTSWQAQTTFPHNERIHHMMMTHLRIGLAIGALAAVLVLWSFWHRAQQPRSTYAFLAILAFMTYAVLQNGDLGSRMVYIEGAAVKPAVSVITGGPEKAQPHGHGATEEGVPGHHH